MEKIIVPPCPRKDRCDNIACLHKIEHMRIASCEIFCEEKTGYMCVNYLDIGSTGENVDPKKH